MAIKFQKDQFIDENGRCVLLRGVNIGANSKFPANPLSNSFIKIDFADHREVSYVGAPIPLEEADEHFQRLKSWGFNCIRLLISWEGIEHAGPGQYDEEYLEYIRQFCEKAGNYGIYILIDPHQDVWARMAGGDGAPGWTFEKVGIDFTKFDAAEAAYVMQYRYDPANPNAFPPMYWSQNTLRFACCTMWTLFLAGKDFAPSCMVDGVNAQEYLQNAFCEAIKRVADKVKDLPNVLGFNPSNEPPQGFIQMKMDGSNNPNLNETLGYTFAPIDAMATASGFTRKVGYREMKKFGLKETRKDEMNPNHISVWMDGVEDIWRKEGVWGLDDNDELMILNNDYFMVSNGNTIDIYRDYLSPFIVGFTQAIRSVMPEAGIFFEGSPERILKGETLNFNFPDEMTNMVHAPHWYDVATLGTKKPMLLASFDLTTGKPVLGKGNISEMFVRQLKVIKEMGSKVQGGVPTILAEFGLPFDLDKKEAYEKFKTEGEKAWEKHTECLNLYYDAIDASLLSSTQWNYTPTNTNELGDGWNLEDLSLFSLDQRTNPSDINSGGRAIHGFVRPHYMYCSGTPTKQEFDWEKLNFVFEFDGNTSIQAPTVIYIPKVQFPHGYKITVSEGTVEQNEDDQIVSISIAEDGPHTVTISKK